jgi:CRP-like cAMP-binding protein
VRKTLYLFGILNEADIEWMMAVGRREYVPAGALLVQEGQPLDAMYIVLQGQFRVSIADGIELACLLAGEVIGEISFVDSRPPTATVTALEDAFVLAIPRSQLTVKLAEGDGFAARFYHALSILLADRLRSADRLHSAVSRLGNSQETDVLEEDFEYPDELDPLVLQRMALAGARFDWMLKNLQVT